MIEIVVKITNMEKSKVHAGSAIEYSGLYLTPKAQTSVASFLTSQHMVDFACKETLNCVSSEAASSLARISCQAFVGLLL